MRTLMSLRSSAGTPSRGAPALITLGLRGTALLMAGAAAPALEARAAADVVQVGPFVGDKSDPLNYPFTLIAASIDLFAGAGRLHSYNDTATAIHLLVSSSLGGDLVTPHSGARIIGFTTGPGWFEFDKPIGRFGAWWNNNSGEDGAMVEFLDVDGTVFAAATATTPAAGNVWVWNGWESDTPIASMRITGSGLLSGFIWFDDLQIAYPAPACPADLNADDGVDGGDLGVLLSNWGAPGVGDLDGSGATDAADLAELLAAWGGCA